MKPLNKVAISFFIIALLFSCIVTVTFDTLPGKVLPISSLQMIMIGRGALYLIISIAGVLFVAHTLSNYEHRTLLPLYFVIVFLITITFTSLTSKIENYIEPTQCCGDYFMGPKWGYPYNWIWCKDRGIDSCAKARTEYDWFAFIADIIFWANFGVCVLGVIRTLPVWLGFSSTNEKVPDDKKVH